MITATFALCAPAEAQAWSRRWRHGEQRIGSEPDLSAARVTLFGELLLVSEPYVPSHCGGVHLYEGRVVAFDRRDGALRWTRTIRQSTGDQAAYLRSHVVGDVVVFETWGQMRAFDERGGVIWSRDGTTDGTCAGGPGAWGEARRGPDLEWNQNGRGCRLNLRTGRVRSLPSLTPSRAEPRRCVPRGGSEHAFVLGDDCDRRGVGWVVARRVRESGGEAYRLLIHYRRRRR